MIKNGFQTIHNIKHVASYSNDLRDFIINICIPAFEYADDNNGLRFWISGSTDICNNGVKNIE